MTELFQVESRLKQFNRDVRTLFSLFSESRPTGCDIYTNRITLIFKLFSAIQYKSFSTILGIVTSSNYLRMHAINGNKVGFANFLSVH